MIWLQFLYLYSGSKSKSKLKYLIKILGSKFIKEGGNVVNNPTHTIETHTHSLTHPVCVLTHNRYTHNSTHLALTHTTYTITLTLLLLTLHDHRSRSTFSLLAPNHRISGLIRTYYSVLAVHEFLECSTTIRDSCLISTAYKYECTMFV